MSAVRFVGAALIWALTWIVPVTFMIVMSWTCEGDARRFGQRIRTHYGDADSATAKEDRAAGNRAFTVARSSHSRSRSPSG
jgi:uncharacterized membrane protein